jgi:hypothetical protein
MRFQWIVLLSAFALVGCATASDVMDAGNGVYVIAAHAGLANGGPEQYGYRAANKFCTSKDPESHAVLVDGPSNTITVEARQAHSKDADIRFRCGR